MAAGSAGHPERRKRPRAGRRALPVSAALGTAAAVLLWLSGCATGGLPVESNDAVVRYIDAGPAAGQQGAATGGVELMLINELHSNYEGLFDANQDRASVKRVPADWFADLLSRLKEHGFFEMAEHGDPRAADSRFVIAVETPAEGWVLAKGPAFSPEDHERFHAMFEDIRSCHDSVWTFKVIENEKGSEFFTEQREKLRELAPKRQDQ